MARVDGLVVRSDAGERASIQGLGVRFVVRSEAARGLVAVVEHPCEPRAWAGPPHTHSREDEYSYVLRGTFGVLVGDEESEAHPGDLVRKPRGIPHTFWNRTDEPASLLEIIVPGGFERYFEEAAPFSPRDGMPDVAGLAPLWERYGLTMDLARLPEFVEKLGLQLPGA